MIAFSTKALNRIDETILKLGGRLVNRRLHVEGGDEIQQNFYTLDGRLLRASEGIRDGFTVRVSAEPDTTALCASMKAKTTR